MSRTFRLFFLFVGALCGACSHVSYEASPRVAQPEVTVPMEQVQILESAPSDAYEMFGEITAVVKNPFGPVDEEKLLRLLREEASEKGCEVVLIRGRARNRSQRGTSGEAPTVLREVKKVRAACIRPAAAGGPPVSSP